MQMTFTMVNIMSVAYTVRLPEQQDRDLTILAEQMDRKKSYLIRKAVEQYVQELKQDQEDLQNALKVLKDNKPNIPWEEVQRNCGLLEN